MTLQMKNELAGVLLDRFGKDIPIRRENEDSFTVRLTVNVSQQFYGWLAGLGKDVKLVAPQNLQEEYKQYLLENLKQYE